MTREASDPFRPRSRPDGPERTDGADGRSLAGRSILVVEDEYLIAEELAAALQQLGATVVGPAGTLDGAFTLLAGYPALDGAVLDIRLGGDFVYPLARTLRERGAPFVFATGYDATAIPPELRDAPLCAKPLVIAEIVAALLD